MAVASSTGSTRERWVRTLLPAAIIVMVYMIFINVGSNRKIAKLSDDVEKRSESAVSQELVNSLQVQKVSLTRQQEKLEQKIDQAESTFSLTANALTGTQNTERMSNLNQLCERLSIGVLNQQTTRDVAVSKIRQEALLMLKRLNPVTGDRYQQIELVGKYGNMVKLMKRLPELGIIPLSIELESTKVERKRTIAGNVGSRMSPGQRIWRVFVLM